MSTLSIDSGTKTYSLNVAGHVGDVTFNPSDTEFWARMGDAMKRADALQDESAEKLKSLDAEDFDALIDHMRTRDKAMKNLIDGVFMCPVSTDLFSNISPFSLGNNGVPIWANILFTIMDVCQTDAGEMYAKQRETMQKYINKYKKRK